MNRESRRKLGISKETSDRLEDLKTPCTVLEAVQLAQGVFEDGISRYHESINPIVVSLSIQVEVLKELLFKSTSTSDSSYKTKSVVNEEEFVNLFKLKVDDYNKQKEDVINSINKEIAQNKDLPKTDVVPNDIEVNIVK